MTTTNAELRALAEKASQSPWLVHLYQTPRDVFIETGSSYVGASENDATYIAATNPTRILELLSQLDSRDEQIADQIEHIGKWESRAHKAEDEISALRAQLEAAEHQIHRLEREIEENSKPTTLISETSAARQIKLDLAIRALEKINAHPAGYSYGMRLIAREALAQLKEQP